jgi:hypothetical protein
MSYNRVNPYLTFLDQEMDLADTPGVLGAFVSMNKPPMLRLRTDAISSSPAERQ